jgi:hypothetical protein
MLSGCVGSLSVQCAYGELLSNSRAQNTEKAQVLVRRSPAPPNFRWLLGFLSDFLAVISVFLVMKRCF